MKHLTEQQVLRNLGIQDFRHLSKKKIMKFFSMLPNMDPEVAKKALDQFPSYANSVIGIIKDYKDVISKMIDSENENTASYYKVCQSILDAIEEELHKDSLSFNEKTSMIDKMLEVEKAIKEYNKDRQKHLLAILGMITAAIGVAIVSLSSAIGGTSSVELPMDDTIE